MSFSELMGLPIRTFWLFHGNVDRISAQRDMRSLTVGVCGQASEAAQSHREQLVMEIGTMVKLEHDPTYGAERDAAGFEELRAMARQ